jgi:presenilin-like A22 family membrane protease
VPLLHEHLRSVHLLLPKSWLSVQFAQMFAPCVVHFTLPSWAAAVPPSHTHLFATHDLEPTPSRYPVVHLVTVVSLALPHFSVASAALFATSVHALHPSVLNALLGTLSFGPPLTA